MPIIRNATIEDAPRIHEIFDYYVKNTAVAFEYETPTFEDFRGRMEQILGRYPYLVLEEDGRICGYVHAKPFVGRAAYAWSCETTIYLDRKVQKRGMGRALYEALEKELKKMGILNLYACIGYPEVPDEYLSFNSADFHAHLGYKKVGVFHKCGFKFGRWYHMIWMEKIIGDHKEPASAVCKYSELE